MATWAEGMRWPLPLPPGVALQWLKDPQNLNALADAYEGSDFKGAEKDKDPALARQIQRVLADDGLRSHLEQAGRRLHASRFSLSRFSAEIARLHRQHFDIGPRRMKS